MKRVWVFWLAICFMLSLVACGGDNQGSGDNEPRSKQQQVSKQKDKQKESQKSKLNKQRANQAPLNRTQNSPLGDQGPKLQMQALAGGSETKGRVLKPGDNYALQRQFPNTLILHSSSDSPKIALTFDDGPDRRFTPQVLDVLKKHDVKATFFLMGSRVDGLPEITKRIADEGHEIGNHTYWHPKLWQESIERIRWEIERTEEAIEAAIGHRTRLFRAPYGGMTEPIVSALAEMNYSVIGWSVDSMDWSQIPAEQIENNVMSNVRPGAIILMHSGGHWTQDLSGMVTAVDRLIPKLKEQGLQFVTISEMIGTK